MMTHELDLAALKALIERRLDIVNFRVHSEENELGNIHDEMAEVLPALVARIEAAERERDELNAALDRAHTYAAFLYSCARSGEQPGEYEDFLRKAYPDFWKERFDKHPSAE